MGEHYGERGGKGHYPVIGHETAAERAKREGHWSQPGETSTSGSVGSIVPEQCSESFSALMGSLTLKTLRGIEVNSLSAVLERLGLVEVKLDRVEGLIGRAHRAEMAKIDQETDALAAQISELAVGSSDEKQIAKLKALAAQLNGIGKQNTP